MAGKMLTVRAHFVIPALLETCVVGITPRRALRANDSKAMTKTRHVAVKAVKAPTRAAAHLYREPAIPDCRSSAE
jgi:hypothetical protein